VASRTCGRSAIAQLGLALSACSDLHHRGNRVGGLGKQADDQVVSRLMNDLRCWPMPGHACLDHAGDRLENFDVVVLVTDLVDPIVADLRVDVRHRL